MTEFLFGAVGAILILAAFSAGFAAACYVNKHFTRTVSPEDPELTPEQKERQEKEIAAQNEAFSQLMGYNMNVAYGLDGVSIEDKEGDEA